jgi:glc operon protein GlcG
MRHSLIVFLVIGIFVLTAATAASAAEPAEPARPPVLAPSSIPLPEARAIIEGAIAFARSQNMRMAVAILDDGGYIVSVDRMDGTSFNSVNQAIGKAFTSVLYRRPSAELAELVKTAPERFYGIMNMWPGKVYIVSGGLPLVVDGKLVGAVGISGLPPGVDEKASKAGLAAWEKYKAAKK